MWLDQNDSVFITLSVVDLEWIDTNVKSFIGNDKSEGFYTFLKWLKSSVIHFEQYEHF